MANNKEFPVSIKIGAIDEISSVVKKINAELKGLKSPTAEIRSQLGQFSKLSGLSNLGASIKNVGSAARNVATEIGALGMKLGFAASAASVGIFALTSSIAKEGFETAKVARIIGIKANELERLRAIARGAGVDTETFDGALKKLTKNLGEAKAGTGTLAGLLEKVSPALLKQVKGAKTSGEAFDLITAAMRQVPDASRRAALATAAFGKQGMELVGIADLTAEQLAAIRKEFDLVESGGITDDEIAKASAFYKAWANFKVLIGEIAEDIGYELMGPLQEALAIVRNYLLENREAIKQFASALGSGIRDALPHVISLVQSFMRFFSTTDDQGKTVLNFTRIKLVLAGVAAAMSSGVISSTIGLAGALGKLGFSAFNVLKNFQLFAPLLPMLMSGFQAVGGGLLTALLSPIGLVIAAVAALAAGAYFLYQKWEPFRNLVDKIGSALLQFGILAAKVSFLPMIIGAKMVHAVWEKVVSLFGSITELLGPVFDWLAQKMSSIVSAIGSFLGPIAKVAGIVGGELASANATFDKTFGLGPAQNGSDTAAKSLVQSKTVTQQGQISVSFDNMPKGARASIKKAEMPMDLSQGFGMVTP